MSRPFLKSASAWLSCSVLVGMVGLAALGHLQRVRPQPPLAAPAIGHAVDVRLAQQAIADALVATPDRTDAIREALKKAGAEIHDVPLRIVNSTTTAASLADAQGRILDGVEVMPMAPNGTQPCTTPTSGLHGTLMVVTNELLARAPNFSGCIAVVDASAPPRELGLNWENYANFGFSAILVTHREGLPQAEWKSLHASLVSAAPLPFPRGVATPAILDHDGAHVVLHLRQDLRGQPRMGLVARLPAAAPNDQDSSEAIILLANLDEARAVPDLAAGPEQRLGAAWLTAAITMLGADPASRQRDVVVIAAPGAAEAQDGLVQLLAALGPLSLDGKAHLQRCQDDLAATTAEIELANQAAELMTNDWLSTEGQTRATEKPAASAWLSRELTYVIGSLVVEAQDRSVQAALAASRAPGDVLAREVLVQAKQREARLGALIGFESDALVQRKAHLLSEYTVAQRLQTRLAERQRELTSRTARQTAEVELATLMRRYHRVLALAFNAPGDGKAAWAMPKDANKLRAITEQLIAGLASTIRDDHFTTPIASWNSNYEAKARTALGECLLPTAPCTAVGWPAATLVSLDSGRRMQRSTWPTSGNSNSVQPSAQALPALRLVQRLVAGAETLPSPTEPTLLSVSGTVLASGIGGSAVPVHPLAGALIGDKPRMPLGKAAAPGIRLTPFIETDLSGRYYRLMSPPTLSGPYKTGWSPTAVTISDEGLINAHSDESTRVQNIAKSLDLGTNLQQEDVNLVCFRAVPVALLDRIDPRTMRTFAGFEFVRSSGLSTPSSMARYDSQPGPQCWFLPPDERLAILLKTGAEDNSLALQMAAFVLGDGARGILAADGPYLRESQLQSATSLASINAERLTGAVAAGLADQRTEQFQGTTTTLLQHAADHRVPQRERILAAREAGAYGQIVYTELRGAISSAVGSIVWYLFLLVPFAFFLERLAFGFSDIRRALTAHAVIFIGTFTFLGLLHPAFRLVGSPLMILLGFVILLISLGVSSLFLARAKENLAELDQRRGGVASAQPDLLGIISTSIALGINGLSRRKVRTGLTCGTLSLITLCLILFVSARSDLIETTKPNGPAPYQGIVIRGAAGRAMPAEELLALHMRYGQSHTVLERKTSIGGVDSWRGTRFNPDIPVARAGGRNVIAHGLLQWSTRDPLLKMLHFTAGNFSSEGLEPSVRPLAIPEEMAQQLGVSAADLPAAVTISGTPCVITGIFDSASLAATRDLDGKALQPFDLLAMTKVKLGKDGKPLGSDEDPLIAAEAVIISDERPIDLAIQNLDMRTTTCAVILDQLPYREARALIVRRMEQTGQPVSYGLDGVAATGRSARAAALDGLVEMLIPLLIAGLTVLNTMRGSVYERRDEIAVYNAVGIAPRFISAMFFAEALVFAVVGSVIGYLLSLLLGRLLALCGWEAGLQVDYASLTPVWASLALSVVVFLSTWFPARAAAEIAAPSDDAGWRVPNPTGDTLSFPLPFAFGARDRIAVLAFFQRIFADHGDGGGGSFQCAEVALTVAPDPQQADDRPPVAGISCQVWHKPFDLGVAQHLSLALLPDPDSGEWLAHLTLTRTSGTRESWLRLNRPFITALRQRFLHWRAVDAATRDELHAEALGFLRGTHVQV